MMTEGRDVLNIDQLSDYLAVPKSTLYRLVRDGKIPSHKVGKHWRFRRESIDRWLDQPPQPAMREEHTAL
jgi:excisionase family DNA binding protein